MSVMQWLDRIRFCGKEGTVNGQLNDLAVLLTRIEHLAGELHADPDAHVRRSAMELRTAFDARHAIEPAVARVRDSIVMLRSGNREGARRESQRQAHGIDHLEQVLERQLLPALRRLGFDV